MVRVVALILALISSASLGAVEEPSNLNITLYRGQFTRTTLGNIMLQGDTDYKPSYIFTGALSTPASVDFFGLPTEWEGQVVKHSGAQKHLEFNAVLMARLGDSLDFSGIPVSFAIGEGLSFATRNPDLENPRSFYGIDGESEYSQNLLNYLVFEVEFGLPLDAYEPRAFIRLHHRSGIYGTFCPRTCGSNYIAYGIKFSPFE
ncbi:MAG TPA: hypothetical protein DEA96_08380 [Leptospiraceae bacterium]|nr:hypothetical protein [Spirochaetaceae bacterium]HBS04966.1 hypothetical protein [Leptospiraceae bacterium]|tara:strand:+ start:635 stop:1243 length:609 start_codon:yes stop_codon:yes gene_type:complete